VSGEGRGHVGSSAVMAANILGGHCTEAPSAIAVYGHDHRVCECVTNCVTITPDDHGLPCILRDA
jgi:hypothetical protein